MPTLPLVDDRPGRSTLQALLASVRTYAVKTARVRRESGTRGLLALTCRRLASPLVTWGGLAFFEKELDDCRPSDEACAPGFSALQLSMSDMDALRDGGDPEQDVAALEARFRRGDRAFAAIDAAGRVCHVRWVATSRVHIPEIARDIVLEPGEAYFYNGYTRPDARRCGVDGLVRNFIFATLQSEGYRRVYSYVRLDNGAGFRAASRWQHPLGIVRYLSVRKSTPWTTRGGPRIPKLEASETQPLQRSREEAWKRWFNSWLDEPLAKRSTGCAPVADSSLASAAGFITATLKADSERDIVLDVGCDSALVSRFVAPHARRFGGVDFITAMLKDGARLGVRTADGHPAWFAAADACRLPFRSQTFTKVYCSAMLHTLPTHEHGSRAIEELIRVTRHNGTVLLSSVPDRAKRLTARLELLKRASWPARMSLPIRWAIPSAVRQLGRRVLRRPSRELPEFLHYDLRALKRALEARGLQCEICDFPPDYWNPEFRTSRSNLLIHVR